MLNNYLILFIKGLAMGGVAAAKAILPGGESPGEAFKRVFDSYTKGNDVGTNVEGGAADVKKMFVEDVQGNTTETTFKTETINNAGNNSNGQVLIGNIDNSIKDQSVKSAKTENSYPPLSVGIDSYFDRDNYNQMFT